MQEDGPTRSICLAIVIQHQVQEGALRANDRLGSRGAKAFQPGGFVRSAAVLGGGTVIGQVAAIAASPLLTRLYSPAEFGLFGVFTMFVASAALLASLKYEAAIVGANGEADASHLAVLSLGLILPMAVVGALLLDGLSRFSLAGFGVLDDGLGLLVLSWAIITVWGASFVYRYWLLREGRFNVISEVTILQSVGRAVGQIGLGVAGAGWVGLAVGDGLGRLFATIRAAVASGGLAKRRLLRVAPVVGVARRYREFPLYLGPSTLVNSLALLLPVPLLTAYYGPGVAGAYFLVERVLAVPSGVIARSVADTFHHRLALSARKGPAAGKRLFLKTGFGLLSLAIPIAVLLAWLGPGLFSVVFGSEWKQAGIFAAMLAPWFLARFSVSPLSRVVLVMGGQRIKLIYDAVAAVAVVSVIGLSGRMGTPAADALLTLSFTQVLVYMVYAALLFRIVSRAAYSFPSEETESTASTGERHGE